MQPPYLSEYFYADAVQPHQMDRLWAQGWRHFGSYFFRYSRLRDLTVIPLRVELNRFAPKRSQKRALARNTDLELAVIPAFVNPEIHKLFERHKQRFRHSIPESLYTFVSERPASLPCRCVCLCLRLEGQLVGVSYLDVGAEATSSVYQCFAPELAGRSLGVLMLLYSIGWSVEQGKRWYYPGYATLEASEYDYKKRLGALQGYDWNHWQNLPIQ